MFKSSLTDEYHITCKKSKKYEICYTKKTTLFQLIRVDFKLNVHQFYAWKCRGISLNIPAVFTLVCSLLENPVPKVSLNFIGNFTMHGFGFKKPSEIARCTAENKQVQLSYFFREMALQGFFFFFGSNLSLKLTWLLKTKLPMTWQGNGTFNF